LVRGRRFLILEFWKCAKNKGEGGEKYHAQASPGKYLNIMVKSMIL
jgi:hypothetical protein